MSEYDTVRIEYGYWNLTKEKDGLKTYYQFFDGKGTILAKGFELDLDEIPVSDPDSLNIEAYVIKSLKGHPINIESAEQRLSVFRIKEIRIEGPIDIYTHAQLIRAKAIES